MMIHHRLHILILSMALLVPGAVRADILTETFHHPIFGQLRIHRPVDEPKGVVLLLSDSGGWSADLSVVARAIAEMDYVVAGVDLNPWLAQLQRSEAPCIDVSTPLDQLNRLMEQDYPLATHLSPILLGYGAGAALGYAALAQAPADRFHAGVGVDFCPKWSLPKPLCLGAGPIESITPALPLALRLKPATRLAFQDQSACAASTPFTSDLTDRVPPCPSISTLAWLTPADPPLLGLKPAALPTTWFVFQDPSACAEASPFLASIPLARMTHIPGDRGLQGGLPQVAALLQWLDPGIVQQVQPGTGVHNIPLIDVPVSAGAQRPQLAVMLSGDGGWALLDRAVTAELAQNGLPVVGWDSLSYFWKVREPDEVALDLERVLRHYLQAWQKERVVLIGYSFGADVLPTVIHRLPHALQERIDLVALLGLSDYASFEFHLSDWLSNEPRASRWPVRQELAKLPGIKKMCIYGAEEDETVCPNATDLGVVAEKMPGDHHFDEDYPGVARRILEQLPPQSAKN